MPHVRQCCYNHPELLKMGDDGFPVVLIDDIFDDALRKHAAEVCPAVAISLQE